MPVTASALSLPDFTKGAADSIVSSMKVVCPLITSTRPGPLPL